MRMEASESLSITDEDIPSPVTLVTKEIKVRCRLVFTSWLVEFEFSDKSRSYTLSVEVDSGFHHVRNTKTEIDPFSEDLSVRILNEPVLALLTSSNSQRIANRESFIIDHQLFSCVFGLEATLPESDVVVVGLPDGRVIWWPWKRTFVRGSQPPFLCHLEQPAVGILTCRINERGDFDDCLLFVGQYGKLITCIAGNKLHPVFSMEFISNPVTSCCAWGNCLYHTVVGGELWQTQLDFKLGPDLVSLMARNLPVLKTHSVALEKRVTEGKKYLWYLTTDGESVTLDIDAIDDLCAKRNRTGAYQTQQIPSLIESLLLAGTKLQTVQQRIQQQKNCLKNLTTAFWLMHGDSSSVDASCSVLKIEGRANGYVIGITVSGLSLDSSGSWHLVCSLSEREKLGCKTYCKSVPVQKDCVSVEFQLTVTLDARHNSVTPPLELECGFLLDQNVPHSSESNCMHVPLKTFQFDEWSFVTSSLAKGHHDKPTIDELLWAIAKGQGYSRPPRPMFDHRDGCFGVSVLMSSVLKAVKQRSEGQSLEEAFLLQLLNPIRDLSAPMFFFGHSLRLRWHVDSDVLIIALESSDSKCTIRLRSALAKRIKNVLQDNVANEEQSIEIGRELQTFSNELLSELKQYDDETNCTQVTKMYERFRNGFSSKLPFV